jgi:hypothetical protein
MVDTDDHFATDNHSGMLHGSLNRSADVTFPWCHLPSDSIKIERTELSRDAGMSPVWPPSPCCGVCVPCCFRNVSSVWQKEILSLRRAPPMALSNPPAQRCPHLLFRHTPFLPFQSLFTQSSFYFYSQPQNGTLKPAVLSIPQFVTILSPFSVLLSAPFALLCVFSRPY